MDVDQIGHDADLDVLRAVVDVLEADAATSRVGAVEHIHLRPDHPVASNAPVTDASLLVDGGSAPVDISRDRRSISLPADLPIGCHTLQVVTGSGAEECIVVVAPDAMPGVRAGLRQSALFVPAYALWESDDPLPSFGHLATVARHLGNRGIDMLATLPLYAAFLDDPFDPSPYSPISRLHWNEAYLADSGFDDPGPEYRFDDHAETVDWRRLAARRRRQLITAAETADGSLRSALEQFVAEHPDVGAYARFRSEHDGPTDTSAEVVERSQVLGQYLCDRQLGEVAGQGATVSLDLPIGSHPAGYETWRYPSLFATTMSVGAPPDTFFTDGQNWGFPPQLPGAMRSSGYDLWRQMIERAGRHADMLRIDHVMAVHRLWWVPDGFPADKGVYVTYPHDELLAVIAATAAASGVSIVGENLGTVPPAVTDALDRWQVLGMWEEQFAMDGPALGTIPAHSVAGIRTHDMAAFAHHVDTTDLSTYRTLVHVEPDDDAGVLLDTVLTRLAASDAQVVVADLDDLLGETRPHNLPGRVVPGIWQRRLDAPISEILSDERVTRRLDILGRTP